MTISPEEIMAYVDGELGEATRARITLAALGDRELAERIAAERALRDRLSAHFAPVAEAPVPEAWLNTIRQATAATPRIVNIADARARKQASAKPAGQRAWTAPWAATAIAASLVLGVFVGQRWQTESSTGPITARNGALLAAGGLARALDTQLASAQDGAPIRMLGTFHRSGGDLCRVFSGAQASGIACHANGQWQLQHVLPGSAPSAAAYQQAGSGNAELMAIAQDMTAGTPLNADEEREAKAKGWR